MRRITLAALACIALALPSAGANRKMQLAEALAVEWIVANCDYPDSIGLTVMVAGMVINGSDPAEVERVRAVIRDGVKVNYPSNDAACDELLSSMK